MAIRKYIHKPKIEAVQFDGTNQAEIVTFLSQSRVAAIRNAAGVLTLTSNSIERPKVLAIGDWVVCEKGRASDFTVYSNAEFIAEFE